MKKRHYILISAAAIVTAVALFAAWTSQATATRHQATPSPVGAASSREALVNSLQNSKTVSLSVIRSANWSAPLSGLINLDNPTAQRAALTNTEEPIQIYTYHLQHPEFGDYLIDTGVSNEFVDNPGTFNVPAWLEPQLRFDRMEITVNTEEVVNNIEAPLQGIFITHLHLDHVSGLPAIDNNVPIYVGKGEAQEKYFLFAATRGIVDALLKGRPELREWQASYVDVFNDGSVFAIHSPGHTAGSTAYLVNTSEGPVLLAGDVSHTAWGWNNQVEPGNFSTNQPRSRESLLNLIKLVEDNPQIQVRLGHKEL